MTDELVRRLLDDGEVELDGDASRVDLELLQQLAHAHRGGQLVWVTVEGNRHLVAAAIVPQGPSSGMPRSAHIMRVRAVTATPQSSHANRVANEIAHGRMLATADSEALWGWSTPAGQSRARRRADLIITAAGLRPGRTILEVGCGTGLFTAQFAATGARIVAVDISPDLLAKAIERQLPADHVRFEERRAESLELDRSRVPGVGR